MAWSNSNRNQIFYHEMGPDTMCSIALGLFLAGGGREGPLGAETSSWRRSCLLRLHVVHTQSQSRVVRMRAGTLTVWPLQCPVRHWCIVLNLKPKVANVAVLAAQGRSRTKLFPALRCPGALRCAALPPALLFLFLFLVLRPLSFASLDAALCPSSGACRDAHPRCDTAPVLALQGLLPWAQPGPTVHIVASTVCVCGVCHGAVRCAAARLAQAHDRSLHPPPPQQPPPPPLHRYRYPPVADTGTPVLLRGATSGLAFVVERMETGQTTGDARPKGPSSRRGQMHWVPPPLAVNLY